MHLLDNININEKNIEVNSYQQFINLIEEEKASPIIKTIEEKKRELFFNLIPEIHKEYVRWKIKHQFNNNVDSYVRKQNLFLNCFTPKLRDLANDEVNRFGANKKDIRTANKRKKEALLYASQLLGLVGKGGSKYLNKSLVDFYINEQKEQENFLENFRLVNSKGKIFKLVSSEKKKERQLAQILNISSAMARIAKDEEYVYCLVTLTLPGSFHPAPIKGSNSFNGVKPLEAQRQIQKFWEDIRANLAKKGLHSGLQYFGAITVEGHADSTLHKHCLIYSSAENQAIIHNVVKEVQARWSERFGEKLNFDISKYDVKRGASGATYIFKYIIKMVGSIFTDDKNKELKDMAVLKNMALRSLYSARSFEFFGIKKVVAKFNFLIENYENFKHVYSNEIKDMFESYDYYSFITKYEQFFKIVRDDKKKISFVLFDTSANSAELKKNILSKKLIIDKKVFSIFETQDNFQAVEISELDKSDINNTFAFHAYENAIDKQINYEIVLDEYIKNNPLVERVDFINVKNEEQDSELVTVIQSLSRKSEKLKSKPDKLE